MKKIKVSNKITGKEMLKETGEVIDNLIKKFDIKDLKKNKMIQSFLKELNVIKNKYYVK